jgi:hypothetical protein
MMVLPLIVGQERSTVGAAHTNKTFTVNDIHCVEECKDNKEPRCLFSVVAPNQMKPPTDMDGREPSKEKIKAYR